MIFSVQESLSQTGWLIPISSNYSLKLSPRCRGIFCCFLIFYLQTFKEYLKLLKKFMKSVNWPKPGYASITCSTISNIPYNLIFTTKFNYSSILMRLFHVTIWICRWRMNTLVTSQYQPKLSSITKIFSRRISQSDSNIQIKLNYSCIAIGTLSLIRFHIRTV